VKDSNGPNAADHRRRDLWTWKNSIRNSNPLPNLVYPITTTLIVIYFLIFFVFCFIEREKEREWFANTPHTLRYLRFCSFISFFLSSADTNKQNKQLRFSKDVTFLWFDFWILEMNPFLFVHRRKANGFALHFHLLLSHHHNLTFL
jgi:hypothetical protein